MKLGHICHLTCLLSKQSWLLTYDVSMSTLSLVTSITHNSSNYQNSLDLTTEMWPASAHRGGWWHSNGFPSNWQCCYCLCQLEVL